MNGSAEEFAPAKVNLSLRILGRRPDGYHELDSLVVFAGVGDRLRAEPAGALSLEITGPRAAALAAEPDNLVLRAARALQAALERTGRPASGARLVLDKRLPVASGIGGGSADAAAALRLLARLWEAPPGFDPAPLAPGLGADIPACLSGRTVRMRGIGERLDPAPVLPECGLVLVNPGRAVSTRAVFGALELPGHGADAPPASPSDPWPDAWPDTWADAPALAAWLDARPNDLEPPAIGLCPAVGETLAAIRAVPGCLLARMSGSGATCFGLFADPGAARDAADTLARPGWWSWGGAPLAAPEQASPGRAAP